MEPQRRRGHGEGSWLALMIGNSRLHWAKFVGESLEDAWDTEHLSAEGGRGELPDYRLPLYLASVVPTQTAFWQTYPAVHILSLDELPLGGVYPTLGIDRALAVLGAAEVWGSPVLVIDAGTALTFTGLDANYQLIGGAILPGLGLQLRSLAQKTAALPKVNLPQHLPPRWAAETSVAIESGIIYTVLAGIQDFILDWRNQYPESQIVLTGGDASQLLNYLQNQSPQRSAEIMVDPNLIFWGMRSVVTKP